MLETDAYKVLISLVSAIRAQLLGLTRTHGGYLPPGVPPPSNPYPRDVL